MCLMADQTQLKRACEPCEHSVLFILHNGWAVRFYLRDMTQFSLYKIILEFLLLAIRGQPIERPFSYREQLEKLGQT